MFKIKKGDTVKVIAGKDKDKEGKVLSVKNGKILVEGVNMITKHAKPSQANPNGGIVQREAAIDASIPACPAPTTIQSNLKLIFLAIV
mgnify:CR=1 FL=1